MLPYYSSKEEVLSLLTQALVFSKMPDRVGGGKVSTAVNSGITFGLYLAPHAHLLAFVFSSVSWER